MKKNIKSDKRNELFHKYFKVFNEVRSKIYKALLGAVGDFRLNLTQSLLTVFGFLLTTLCIVSILFTASSVMVAKSYDKYPLGSNSITLKVNYTSNQDYLTELRELKLDLKRVKEVVPMKDIDEVEMYGNQRTTSSGKVVSTDDTYLKYAPIKIEDGRSINAQDVSLKSAVAVIAQDIATELYGKSEPIGQEIKLNNQVYTVVGIFSGTSKTAPSYKVIIPYTSARLVMKSTFVDTYTFVGISEENNEASVIEDFIKGKISTDRTIALNNAYSIERGYESNNMNSMNKIGYIIYFIMLIVSGLGLVLLNMYVARRSKSRSELSRKKLRKTYCIFKSEFFCIMIIMIGTILGIIFGLLVGVLYCKIVQAVPIFNLVLLGEIFKIFGISLLFSILIGAVPGVLAIKNVRRDMV